MNITEIIFSALGTIITALVSWGVGSLIAYLNGKVKNEKIKGIINNVGDIVEDAVKEVYQVYVEALKYENLFDKKAQKTALNMALNKAKSLLNEDTIKYITENKGSVDEYLTSEIESTIYELKNKHSSTN